MYAQENRTARERDFEKGNRYARIYLNNYFLFSVVCVNNKPGDLSWSKCYIEGYGIITGYRICLILHSLMGEDRRGGNTSIVQWELYCLCQVEEGWVEECSKARNSLLCINMYNRINRLSIGVLDHNNICGDDASISLVNVHPVCDKGLNLRGVV